MNHKEMTQHIRSRVKANGIKANVRKFTACGTNYIAVSTTGPDKFFTSEEQRDIRRIAKVNGLTRARKMEIVIDQDTDPQDAHFEFHAA